jgi:hypothetical protein
MKTIFSRLFIFCFILLLGFERVGVSIVMADGTYAGIGTSDGADGSNDAINFAQGRVWTIDQYGKYIWSTQNRDGSSHWAWSNNSGSSWTQGSESYSFLTRASVAYDSINDKLHVIWTATNASDGIIYRRYGITRDGSNNITALSREDSSNINLQLDTSASRNLEQAAAYWVNDGSTNGILVAVWSKNGGSLNEVRASMRKLSLSAADGVAGNWVSLDGTGDTFGTDPPAVAADKVYTSGSGSNAVGILKRGGTGSHKDDFYIFVATSGSNQVLAYRATWKAASGDWGNGWTAIGQVGAMDTSSGYNLKYQLITKPVLDSTNDRLYIGWARWKDGTNGDTVSIAYLNATDAASSTIDVYSALGTHSYAPTLDIAYDSTMDKLYVAYIESTTNGDNGSIDYKTYDGSSLSTSSRFYTSPGGSAGADGSADIPILFENRQNGRLLFAFRINGALPPTAGDKHVIDWGYVTLPTPTPTPTPTPSPSPTPAASSTTTNSTPSMPKAPVCSVRPPGQKEPWIYADTTTATSATIYFTEASQPFSEYVVSYGQGTSSTGYGTTIVTGPGLRTITLSSLSPNTQYVVKLRAGNSCAVGPWSAEHTIRTKKMGGVGIRSSIVFEQRPSTPKVLDPLVIKNPSSPTPLVTPVPNKVRPSGTPIATVFPTATPTTPIQTESFILRVLKFFRLR